jgi:hypothetical protein
MWSCYLTSFYLACCVVGVMYYIYWYWYCSKHHVLWANSAAFHGINYAAYHIHEFALFVACILCMYSMPVAARVLLTSCNHLMWVIPIVRCCSQNCEQHLLALSCLSLSVRLSLCMEQLSSHWMVFHEIWYLSIFKKFVENVQVSLISDKNDGYFTRRPMYMYDHISFTFS